MRRAFAREPALVVEIGSCTFLVLIRVDLTDFFKDRTVPSAALGLIEALIRPV